MPSRRANYDRKLTRAITLADGKRHRIAHLGRKRHRGAGPAHFHDYLSLSRRAVPRHVIDSQQLVARLVPACGSHVRLPTALPPKLREYNLN
jgi:hypothetical protein